MIKPDYFFSQVQHNYRRLLQVFTGGCHFITCPLVVERRNDQSQPESSLRISVSIMSMPAASALRQGR